jgi:PAS domain S-box-containing protein
VLEYTRSNLPQDSEQRPDLGDVLSFLEVPIFVGQTLWGFLGFDDCREERRWGAEASEVLLTTAASLGEAIRRSQTEESLRQSEARNRQLLADSQRQSQRLGLLLRLSQSLGQEVEPESLYRTAVEAISSTFSYEMVSLYLQRGDELVMQHQVGYPQWLERVPLDRGVMARSVRLGQPILVSEARHDPDFVYLLPDICSDIAVPLTVQGRTIGVINLESRTIHFGQGDLELMTAVAAQVNMAVERTLGIAALREQETFYRKVLDNLADGVTLFEDETFIYVNAAGLKSSGAERPEQLVGKTFAEWLEHASVEDAPLPSKSYVSAMDHNTAIPFTEDRFRNLRGEIVETEVAVTPMTLRGKQISVVT